MGSLAYVQKNAQIFWPCAHSEHIFRKIQDPFSVEMDVQREPSICARVPCSRLILGSGHLMLHSMPRMFKMPT